MTLDVRRDRFNQMEQAWSAVFVVVVSLIAGCVRCITHCRGNTASPACHQRADRTSVCMLGSAGRTGVCTFQQQSSSSVRKKASRAGLERDRGSLLISVVLRARRYQSRSPSVCSTAPSGTRGPKTSTSAPSAPTQTGQKASGPFARSRSLEAFRREGGSRLSGVAGTFFNCSMHAAQGALSLLLFPVVGRAFVGHGCLSALAGVAVVIYCTRCTTGTTKCTAR